MELEAVRAIADWLKDATNGVDTVVALVPRDVGDAAPPALATRVFDESRHTWAARGEIPEDVVKNGPLLVVALAADTPIELHLQKDHDEGRVMVGVHYATKTGGAKDSQIITQDAMYVLRGVKDSIKLLFQEAHVANRKRNQVELMNVADVRLVRAFRSTEYAEILGAIAFTVRVRAMTCAA